MSQIKLVSLASHPTYDALSTLNLNRDPCWQVSTTSYELLGYKTLNTLYSHHQIGFPFFFLEHCLIDLIIRALSQLTFNLRLFLPCLYHFVLTFASYVPPLSTFDFRPMIGCSTNLTSQLRDISRHLNTSPYSNL